MKLIEKSDKYLKEIYEKKDGKPIEKTQFQKDKENAAHKKQKEINQKKKE